jgi:20S proteasome alpha/beta subunit
MSTDYSLTTFDKQGNLAQIKHAMNAVAKGETALGKSLTYH